VHRFARQFTAHVSGDKRLRHYFNYMVLWRVYASVLDLFGAKHEGCTRLAGGNGAIEIRNRLDGFKGHLLIGAIRPTDEIIRFRAQWIA
jgi:hypothetical protein